MSEFDVTNWRMEKIKTLEELSDLEGRVVTVNGSFDLMHAGHLDQLEEAKQQGDVLVVGLNSDTSVREAKGEGRPLIPQEARAAMLAALACVDFVTIVDEAYDEVPSALIRAVKPAVHVNGPEYGKPSTWREWEAMVEVGAEGYSVQHRNDLSTSGIVERIKR